MGITQVWRGAGRRLCFRTQPEPHLPSLALSQPLQSTSSRAIPRLLHPGAVMGEGKQEAKCDGCRPLYMGDEGHEPPSLFSPLTPEGEWDPAPPQGGPPDDPLCDQSPLPPPRETPTFPNPGIASLREEAKEG